MSLILFFLLLTFNFGLSTRTALAQCPVCVITVGGGMLLAKKLGVDDFLVSIWISALNTVISFWLAPKFRLKYLRNPHLLSLLMLGFTLFYFKFTGQISNKIILGQLLGLALIAVANHSYLFVKKTLGHTPFPYAKVAFPLGLVTLVTIFFKFLFNL